MMASQADKGFAIPWWEGGYLPAVLRKADLYYGLGVHPAFVP